MKQSERLREKRAEVYSKLENILKAAEQENRELTAEEQSVQTQALSDLDKFDADIVLAEKSEQRMAQKAATFFQHQENRRETQELKRYSIIRALKGQMTGALDGLEKELHDEAVREAREAGIEIQGLGVSLMALRNMEFRDMSASTATEGGNFIQTDKGGFFGALKAKLILAQAGAQIMDGLIGNFTMPGITTGVVGSVATSENATIAETQPTIGAVALTPKRIGAVVEVSKQLMLQVSPSVNALVNEDILSGVRVKLESQAINGAGTAGQITGILNTTGIGSVTGGAHGLAPSWTHIVNLEGEVAVDNADLGALAYLTNTKVRSKLKVTDKFGSTAASSGWIWEMDPLYPLNGYKAHVTTNVPATLTKGTSTGVCSAIIFGNFNDLIIGNWGGLDILVDPYTKGADGIIRLIVNSYWDAALRRPESMAAMLDALTA